MESKANKPIRSTRSYLKSALRPHQGPKIIKGVLNKMIVQNDMPTFGESKSSNKNSLAALKQTEVNMQINFDDIIRCQTGI